MAYTDDIDLVESVRNGNTADYGLLMDRYKDRAFSLLCRMLKNPLDAEEALQDAFLRAFRALSGFRNDARFSTWLYKIVYNTALNHLASRRHRQETATSGYPANEHTALSVTQQESGEGARELLNNLILRLPPAYAAVINLYYLDELAIDEIAAITALTPSNIKVLLFRARKALKQRIMEQGLTEDLL